MSSPTERERSDSEHLQDLWVDMRDVYRRRAAGIISIETFDRLTRSIRREIAALESEISDVQLTTEERAREARVALGAVYRMYDLGRYNRATFEVRRAELRDEIDRLESELTE